MTYKIGSIIDIICYMRKNLKSNLNSFIILNKIMKNILHFFAIQRI